MTHSHPKQSLSLSNTTQSGRKKKKSGSDVGSGNILPQILGGKASRKSSSRKDKKHGSTSWNPTPQKQSPNIDTHPSNDATTISAITNPTFLTPMDRDPQVEEAANKLKEEQQRILAQRRVQDKVRETPTWDDPFDPKIFEKQDPFRKSNLATMSSEETTDSEFPYPPVTSKSDHGDSFFEGNAPSEDIDEYADEDPDLDVMGDVSSTDSRRDGEEISGEDEEKDEEDLFPMRESNRMLSSEQDLYQPKYAHEYDLMPPPPPPPPPRPTLHEMMNPPPPPPPPPPGIATLDRRTNKNISPSRRQSQPQAHRTVGRYSPSPSSEGQQSSSPSLPHSRARPNLKGRATTPSKPQRTTNTFHKEPQSRSFSPQPQRIQVAQQHSPDVSLITESRMQRARNLFERRDRQTSRSPIPQERARTNSPPFKGTVAVNQTAEPSTPERQPTKPFQRPSPERNSPVPENLRRSSNLHRTASPVPSMAEKREAEALSMDTGSMTPGMAARLRDRQRIRSGRSNPEEFGKSGLKSSGMVTTGPTSGMTQKLEDDPSARLFRSPSPLTSTENDTSGNSTMDPFHHRQSRLSQQFAPSPNFVSKKKTTNERRPLQPAQSCDSFRHADSIGSVGRDINKLRAIHRATSTRGIEPISYYGSSGDYSTSTHDENDPMQRASLRLLSKQVIPIQTAIRRYLALRVALTRMWAVIEIQACARRFLVFNSLDFQHDCACLIQSVYRGGRVRDQVLLEHCCAVEIQRCVRGYLATLAVYEEIYQITLVQSIVRRKQAIDRATDRMVFVIQLQSLARGYLCRKRMADFHAAATVLQRNWRGSIQRLCYELDLLDIVIIQTTVRRLIARKHVNYMRSQRDADAATKIQTSWRRLCQRLMYQMDICDIIVVQSQARVWFARKEVDELRSVRNNIAATKIQAQWRCYDFSVIFRQYIAARKIQTAWRSSFSAFKYKLDLYSILVVQSLYRGRKARLKFKETAAVKQNRAATIIQTAWRSYSCFIAYQIKIFSVITVQSLWRGKRAREYFGMLLESRRHVAATMVQSLWRCYSIRVVYLELQAAIKLQSAWRRYVCESSYREHKAATKIQSRWRSYDCTMNYLHYLADVLTVQGAVRAWIRRREQAKLFRTAAIKIQSVARLGLARNHVGKVMAARSIQIAYRRHVGCSQLRRLRAACCIARTWRGYKMRQTRRVEYSAVLIQKTWRGFVSYADYMFVLADIVMVQTVARRFLSIKKRQNRSKALKVRSATKIQAVARSLHTRKVLAAVKIQCFWRSFVAETVYFIERFENRAATIIQTAWRRYIPFTRYLVAIESAILIQAAFRRYCAYNDFALKIEAAVVIQNAYRNRLSAIHTANCSAVGYILSKAGSLHETERHAATMIQKTFKGTRTRRAFNLFVFARRIQTKYRGWRIRQGYTVFIAARKIQALARGWRVHKAYTLFIAARKIQSAARMHRVRVAYTVFISARKIQTFWRSKSTAYAFKVYLASRTIQAAWRAAVVRHAYRHFGAARCIQTMFRCVRARVNSYHLRQRLKEYCAAILIQSCIRRKSARMAFVAYRNVEMAEEIKAVVVVQRVWRGFVTRSAGHCFVQWIKIHEEREAAATTVQRYWRGFFATEVYWQTLGSVILIQSLARQWKEERKYNAIYGAAIIVQSIARMVLAKLEVERRKFILTLVQTINDGKKKPIARGPNNKDAKVHWEKVLEEQRKLDRAARVIQRFFSMVKKEVDLAIRAEKKRRKKRRKKRQHRKVASTEEDALLENVWQSIEEPSNRQGIGYQRGAHKLPAEYAMANRGRPVDEDTRSFISTSSVGKVPKSRMGLATRIIDEDFALETAWMDAGINMAKRMTHTQYTDKI